MHRPTGSDDAKHPAGGEGLQGIPVPVADRAVRAQQGTVEIGYQKTLRCWKTAQFVGQWFAVYGHLPPISELLALVADSFAEPVLFALFAGPDSKNHFYTTADPGHQDRFNSGGRHPAFSDRF
jgi:hypothetical protein